MEEKLFELMTKLYEEVREMNSNVKNVEQKVEAMGNHITFLENKLNEKLDALFDARLVGIDKDVEISTTIQRVEQKVDKLQLRLLKKSYEKPK